MALALVPTMLRLGYRPRPQLATPLCSPRPGSQGRWSYWLPPPWPSSFSAPTWPQGSRPSRSSTTPSPSSRSPYGVFVVAIATALMPELSENHSRGDADGYRETFSFGLRTMTFVVVPSAVGMISLSRAHRRVALRARNFDATDTVTVSGLLVVYAAGLLGYSVYFFLVRAFYSRQNTKTPALLNVAIFVLHAGSRRPLPRLGREERGARSFYRLRRARRSGPRGDAPGDGPDRGPAPRSLSAQDPRGRDGHVRHRQNGNLTPRDRLGLHGAPPRPRYGGGASLAVYTVVASF